MILKPKIYKTKKSEKLELRLYVAGRRVKSLAEKRPICFGYKGILVNCRCRCSLSDFCKKVSIQFTDELEW